MSLRVLVTCPHLQRTLHEHAEWLQERDIIADAPSLEQQLSENELLEIIEGYDGAVAGDDPFTARVLERGRRLRVVAKWGIGLDAIDLDAARRLGIHVYNTPGAFGDEVADVVVGYLVLLSRHLHIIDREVRAGGWPKIEGQSLAGKTLAVLGAGSVGSAVLRRGAAMGMRLTAYDPRGVDATTANAVAIESVSFDGLLRTADYLVVCCNLSSENRHLIGEAAFAALPRGARLINVSRGAIIDEPALIDALESGHLAGAALDVFVDEPLPASSALRGLSMCILGSHNASNTSEAVRRVNALALENLALGLRQGRYA